MQLSEEMMMILTSFLLQALSGDTSGENMFLLLVKTHIHMFSFCSGLSCRSMHINLFSSVDIKLLTGDVSWWIWSVCEMLRSASSQADCPQTFQVYSEGFFLLWSLSASCMEHFIPKIMETLYGCWRLLCKNLSLWHVHKMKQDFLHGDVC